MEKLTPISVAMMVGAVIEGCQYAFTDYYRHQLRSASRWRILAAVVVRCAAFTGISQLSAYSAVGCSREWFTGRSAWLVVSLVTCAWHGLSLLEAVMLLVAWVVGRERYHQRNFAGCALGTALLSFFLSARGGQAYVVVAGVVTITRAISGECPSSVDVVGLMVCGLWVAAIEATMRKMVAGLNEL